MYLLYFLRFFKGYINFNIIGSKIEKFFNEVSKNKIPLWGTVKRGHNFSSFTTIKNYRKLQVIARKMHINLKIRKKYGIPFILHRYRKRIGILIGVILSGLFMFIMSQFLWSIEIHGAERINPTDLIRFMSEMNIKPGVIRRGIDVKNIERAALLKFNDISWISINICGSRANVEIKECTLPPQQIDEKEPCNIVASKSGWIKYMEVYDGQKVIDMNNFVYKGQLIVSGIIEDGHLNNTLKHSRAKVIAEVDEIVTVEQPLIKSIKIYKDINKVHHNISIELLGVNIPICSKNSSNDKLIETNKSTIYPKLFNISIPLVIHKSEVREIINHTIKLSQPQAKIEAEKKIAALEKNIKNKMKIINKELILSKTDGEKYVIQNKYIVEQDIASPQEILFGTLSN